MSERAPLHHHVLRHAGATPHAPAIATPTARLTYAVLAQRMLAFAGHLRAHGLAEGDRVVVALPNGPAMVVTSLAVQALGGTAVEVDRGWAAGALEDVVRRVGARQVVTWGRDARKWGDALDGLALDQLWVVHREPPTQALMDALRRPAAWLADDGGLPTSDGALASGDLPEVSPEGVAVVLFTSGSTGTPQGVLQTHRNIDANSHSIVEYLGLTREDRALATLPLYYCYGRSLLQTHLLAGGSVYFDDRFAFPRTVMEALGTEGCTGFAGVPLTFEILRRSVDLSSVPMPTLRYVTQAGGAMAPDTIRWTRAAFAPAPLFVMYGQTEATARVTYLPPDRAHDKEGSIGIPIPGVEVRVLGDDGTERLPGALGEIVVRGESVTPGYLDDPAATAGILRDGWLRTGDLGVQDDDGYLFHRGRAREMLKVGGRRVSPVEIEQAIERHPGVVEAAVRGVPDDLKGEVPAAYVVLAPGADLSGEALRGHLRATLAPWLLPATITFLDRLPRNAAGKLLRADLPVPGSAVDRVTPG